MSNDTIFTDEVWKPVVGYENAYSVSNKGRVMRSVANRHSSRAGYMMSLRPNRYGYLMVLLCQNAIKKTCSVHRLVAAAFLPEVPDKPFVNHIDGNKANNCVENLEYCTQRENSLHAIKLGLQKGKRGSTSHFAKLNDEKVAEIRRLYAQGGISQYALARQFGVTQGHVSEIIRGKKWLS